MPKMFDEYMNNSRIKDEPMGLRITHAMRFKVQEERDSMTEAEYRSVSQKRLECFFQKPV